MWHSRVPWAEKLRPEMKPKIVEDPRGRGRVLVPTPLLLAEEIRKVRKGRLTTPCRIRNSLAARFGCDSTCPLATGILLIIVAGASEDSIANGKRPVAPYWRVVREDGSLNEKYPRGAEVQAKHLRNEGHRVGRRAKGGKLFVHLG